jgi:hypothetical protein
VLCQWNGRYPGDRDAVAELPASSSRLGLFTLPSHTHFKSRRYYDAEVCFLSAIVIASFFYLYFAGRPLAGAFITILGWLSEEAAFCPDVSYSPGISAMTVKSAGY